MSAWHFIQNTYIIIIIIIIIFIIIIIIIDIVYYTLFIHLSSKQAEPILTSLGLNTRFQRPWQTGPSLTLFTWRPNDTLSQPQLLPSVHQRIRQGVDLHEVLKNWPEFLELQGMLRSCQPIMLPLLWAVNGWELALLKQGELNKN